MLKSNKEFIDHNFNLPDNTNKLYDLENIIGEIKLNLEEIFLNKKIDNIIHESNYEKLIQILFHLGEISTPASEISDELEKLYIVKFKHSPELAKKLWLDHYSAIHHPYNTLKNRCFKLLDQLDEQYYKKFKVPPPNWRRKDKIPEWWK